MELTGREIFLNRGIYLESPYYGYQRQDNYQLGYGYGFIFGSAYNYINGEGKGVGYIRGDGNFDYPYQLIQYWE